MAEVERIVAAYRSDERVPIPVDGTDDDLIAAINEFYTALPGWWFTVGRCSVSCHASVGPDGNWVANPLLDLFDDGFHSDLALPTTLAEVLRSATAEGVARLAETEFTSTGRRKGE